MQKMNKRLLDSIEKMERLKAASTAEERQLLYSRLKASRDQASFAIMMRMNPETLTSIRKEFFNREDAVDLKEFVYILKKHLSGQAAISELEINEFAANMVDLFKEIDVNGDENVSWIEFTSYIVEKAGSLKNHFRFAQIAHYQNTTRFLHPSSQQWRRFEYSKLCPLPNRQFAAIEDLRKSIFIFHSKSGHLHRTVHTSAVPVAITYARESQSDLLIAACSDMSIVVYNLDDHGKKVSLHHIFTVSSDS